MSLKKIQVRPIGYDSFYFKGVYDSPSGYNHFFLLKLGRNRPVNENIKDYLYNNLWIEKYILVPHNDILELFIPEIIRWTNIHAYKYCYL